LNLDELKQSVNLNNLDITVQTEKLVKCIEYVKDSDSKIQKLFEKVFGDYTSICVREIIEAFEKKNDIYWESFYRRLMRERDNFQTSFMNNNSADLPIDDDPLFINNLYEQPNHQLLYSSAQTLSWTILECDMLFAFV